MELPAWTRLIAQHDRLIEIDTALPQAFVVERLQAREALCEPFRFELDVLAARAGLDLRPLLGSELSLRLRGPAYTRHWHGYCTQASQLGSDGGLARYRLRLEPWTALLQLRRNRLLFPQLDLCAIVQRLLAHYPQAHYRFELSQSLPPYPLRTQWESDHDFITRLLTEAGLAWRYEHTQDTTREHDHQARHTLVIYDQQAAVPDAQPASLRFHRIDATESADAILTLSEQYQIAAQTVAVASWQREQLRLLAGRDGLAAPALPPLEFYQAARSGAFASNAQADAAARRQLQALQLPVHTFHGAGSGRQLAPGLAFSLRQHPLLDGIRLLPVVVEHYAINNLGSEVAALRAQPELSAGDYRNRFLAVTAETPITPLHIPPTTAPGPQTALVVGRPDSDRCDISSDRDHQCRLQFWWQRGSHPNPGGLPDPHGHAPGDASAGAWVPVAEWSSGPNFGSHFLPRVGSEVLVDFQHGDLDQPVVLAQLYGGRHRPPYAATPERSDSPAGAISGFRSLGLDGQAASRWILDDSPGQLRHQLDTELTGSRLTLGMLADQVGASRGPLRGEGWELSSLGWQVQRSGQGLLISSSARPGARSSLHDADEAMAQLDTAIQTAQTLSDAAVADGARALPANARQRALQQALAPARSQAADHPAPQLTSPLILQDSASHLLYSSTGPLLAHASGAQHWTVAGDAQHSAGEGIAAVAGDAISLHAAQGPIQLSAEHGPISLQAHAGPLQVSAEQALILASQEDSIEILAQQKIVLQAGASTITLEGQNISFACPGNFSVKSSRHAFMKGEKQGVALPHLPSGGTLPARESAAFRYTYHDGEPFQGAAYTAHLNDGASHTGRLDAQGHFHLDGVKPGTVSLSLGSDVRRYQSFKLPFGYNDNLVRWQGS